MILYASNPDQLAQQQLEYDRMYGSANENNAARYDAAQSRAVEAILRQRAQDQQQQQFDQNNISQGQDQQAKYDFYSQQGALDRASRSADAAANKAVNFKTENDRQEAEEMRSIDILPTDPEALKRYFPNWEPERIARVAGQAATAQHLIQTNQNLKDQPQNDAAAQGQTLAYQGNLFQKILADQAAIKNSPTDSQSWWNSWIPNSMNRRVPSASIIQPSDAAAVRLADISRNLAPTLASAGKKDSLIQVNPATGGYTQAVPFTSGYQPTIQPPVAQPAAAPLVSGTGNMVYNSEAEARADGKQNGDIVYFNVNGVTKRGVLK